MTERSTRGTERRSLNLGIALLALGLYFLAARHLHFRGPGPILLLTTGDATLRIGRSARAWMAVDPGRAWFRVAWVIVSCVLLAVIVAAMIVVLRA
jgi:hypothetical protein